MTIFDLIGRLLLIERKEAIRYGFDPAAVLDESRDEEQVPSANTRSPSPLPLENVSEKPSLGPLAVVLTLAQSSRALTAMLGTFMWG